jgi:8-oxo-dGTP pyrophosphatase MutT (NUDIX family)
MEDGETEEECARREVDEELGVIGLPPPACRMVLCRQVYFVFEVSVLPLRPMDTLEILEVRWMTVEEMRGVSLNAAGVAFVQRMLPASPRIPKHRLSEECYLAVERLAKQRRLEHQLDGQAFYSYVMRFFDSP